MDRTGAELLFEVFSQRYERGSILVPTNLPFDEWTEVFGSDRLTHHVPTLTNLLPSVITSVVHDHAAPVAQYLSAIDSGPGAGTRNALGYVLSFNSD